MASPEYTIERISNFVINEGMSFSIKVLGAITAWIIGRWIIGLVIKLIGSLIQRGGKLDRTLTEYLKSIINVILNIVLILAMFDIFGVQTTSFTALLAGAGLAIGTAWGGLLTHFAAGVFMQMLRPYKVGDFVTAGDVTGTVTELGLFSTIIVTPDNVLTIIGNNQIFSDKIKNYSVLAYRRVDCTAKIANGVDAEKAIALLKQSIPNIPNVLTNPAPDIDVLEFTASGPVLCVRPYTHNDNYWQVYFDTNRAILNTFGEAGFPVPETPEVHRNI